MAIVWAVALFWYYLYGYKFIAMTNCQLMKWFMDSNKPIGSLLNGL